MDDSTLTGKTVGKYKIEERIGRGGMAEVYRGYQENLERYVAIKVMHTFLMAEEDFLQRFKREARAMASLSHPNIVRVFDFDVYTKESYYLVMEYIDGGTLKEKLEALLQNDEKIPLEQSVTMITEVADALAYAHRRGMVHRDIKPANIMLRSESGQAVLTDFGIVKLIGNQSMAYTATGALIGTPAYMSPEQALGQSGDERVDIYSLGVLLFQMVTNQLPFAADTPLAVVMKHVNDPTPMPGTFNPDVPLDLQEVIMKAMAKEPDNRYQSAAEMAAALRAVNFAGPKATTAVAAAASGAATAVPASTLAGQTAVSPEQPATILQPPAEATAVAPPPVTASRKPPIALIAGIVIGLLIITGGILFATGVIGGNTPDPTAESLLIAAEETDTPRPSATPEATTAADEGSAEANVVETRFAELSMDLTKAAAASNTPTKTATPTKTSTPTPSATIDETAVFLANCDEAVNLVSAFRENTTNIGVFPNASFTVEWILANNGTCPWPPDLQLVYDSGETFGYDGEPIAVGTAVAPGAEVSLTAAFRAPAQTGLAESTWRLENEAGAVFGDPITFAFRVVPRATATPTRTPAPLASPTPEITVGEGTAAYIFTVGTCDYPGGGPDWRCAVTITPYLDGTDDIGVFTLFVFDLPGGQAAQYRGSGPFTHFVSARRCAAYNQGIRVVEDTTATEKSGQLYIDPNIYFAGGCTEN